MQQTSPEVLHVVVLKGGTSAERDVSLRSGEQVALALRASGCKVDELDTCDTAFIDQLIKLDPDVVYIALHGRGGEDGTMQGLLEILGYPYVGSGVLASSLAVDKVMSKHFYEQAGLPTAPYIVARNTSNFNKHAFIEQAVAELGEHLVVKPASEGSSIGMSIIEHKDQLAQALDLAFESDPSVLVEQFIAGDELTVGVLGNSELEALPPVEITAEGAFYDYASKYNAGQSNHFIPARMGDAINATCQELAIAVHRTLGCRGISRTDIIVDAQGKPWILETNTLPGMTEVSLVPDAARAAGYSFPQLCKRVVELACETVQ